MCNNDLLCFSIVNEEGKDELGVLDDFGIGDYSSCNVEINLERNNIENIYLRYFLGYLCKTNLITFDKYNNFIQNYNQNGHQSLNYKFIIVVNK